MTFFNREIDHINLTVPNISQAISFYTDILGFKITHQFDINGMNFVFISNGTISYELIENPSVNGTLEHIAYSSQNLQKDHDYFKSKNLQVTPINFLPGLFDNGMHYFFLLSPTNERIEFCSKA